MGTKIETSAEVSKIAKTTMSGNGHMGPKKKKVSWMENVAVNHTNKVMGLVYVGAAFLIIVVGLRGLGSIVGDISLIPRFIIDSTSGKIHSDYVIAALFLEFLMLILLSTVTFFTPVEEGKKKAIASLEEFREGIKEIKDFTQEELKVMKSYIDEFEIMSGKISQVHMANVESLKKMSDILKK